MTVVPVDPRVCPDCGSVVRPSTTRQDALVRGAGYGGTEAVTVAWCPSCGWARVREVTTERPPR